MFHDAAPATAPKSGTPRSMVSSMGDVGHVAPDFEDRRHFNTLVVRPEYRITLRIGEIEDLFPDLPNTDPGRMARMQVLGLFYFPLKHKRAAAALPVALDHFQKKVLTNASLAQADAAMQNALHARVISGAGAPPAFNPAGGGTAALPVATAKGATPGPANFGKIRFPGGYTYLNDSTGLNLNRDSKYAFDFGADTFAVESRYFQDNPVLGKIPLIAKVEKREGDTDKFKPAEDVSVYFQLLLPDALPAFNAAVAPSAQINRPALRTNSVGPPVVAAAAGPAQLTNTEEARHPAPANDVQGTNCHADRGGKRGKGSISAGTDVAGVIFETTSRKGFNAPHANRPLPHPAFPVAEKVTPAGARDIHAVRALTNPAGEAGVIFTPSRTGGDRYRLRAYIGLPSLPDDGTGAEAVRVDTGTLVVWRNIRISRYLQQPFATPDASLVAEVNPAPYNLANVTAYLQRGRVANAAGNTVGFRNADFSALGTAGAPYDGVTRQFARAFCEVELDPGSTFPEQITAADWQAALTQAIADGTKGAARTGVRFDLKLLMCQQAGTPINGGNAFCHLPMHTAEAYNALLPAGSPKRMALRATGGAVQAHRDQVNDLFWNFLIEGIQRFFSRDGMLPGLTVIQSAVGCTWQQFPKAVGVDRNSGLGENYRSASVWFGAVTYPTAPQPPGTAFPYDCTSNFCHEMGHLLYREHGPGQDPGNTPGGGASTPHHDPLASSICVMSYKTCEGQFCAKCLFAFRGWHSFLMH